MYREVSMSEESILGLNEIERELADNLLQKLASGAIPATKKTNKTNYLHMEIGYEYSRQKKDQILRGMMLGCPYKLRYRDSNHVFFSAWNCKDVCSIFYDVIVVAHAMNGCELHLEDTYRKFTVDLNVKDYVFCTGEVAASIVSMINFLSTVGKISYSSQYIFTVFEEAADSAYTVLLEKLKAEGYSQTRLLQVWIRGEILYYAMADGMMLRPAYQRSLSPKEERDIIRKIGKATTNVSSRVDLHQED
jgi:hypothetical protein